MTFEQKVAYSILVINQTPFRLDGDDDSILRFLNGVISKLDRTRR